MKKKRFPFFTICALLCATILFYLDNQKPLDTQKTCENLGSEEHTCEHKHAASYSEPLIPELTKKECTELKIFAREKSDAEQLEQELQCMADQETKKLEYTQDSEPAQTLVIQPKTTHNAEKNAALKSDAPDKEPEDRIAEPGQASAPESYWQIQEHILHPTAQDSTAPHSTTPSTTVTQATAPYAPDQGIPREIIVKNSITPAMLSYAHWTGTYSPTLFEIEVNGSPLDQGAQRNILLDKNNNFTVSYRYSFMNGYKTGARKVTFSVEPERLDTPEQPDLVKNSSAKSAMPAKSGIVELEFSWKNKWHVISNQATHEHVEDIK